LWAVALAGFFLDLITNGLNRDGFLSLALLLDEIVFRDTQAVQQGDYLSVEETLTKRRHPDNVQAQIGTGKLDLAVSKLHLHRSLHPRLDHEDALRSGNADLEGGGPCRPEVILGDLGGQFFADVADAVCKVEPIPLDVGQVHLDIFVAQGCYKLARGEALTLASKPLQDILLVVERAHEGDNLLLGDRGVQIILTEEPARVVLQL